MARLTDEEFRAWCQRNHISPATEAYIQRIRSSQLITIWEVVGGESK